MSMNVKRSRASRCGWVMVYFMNECKDKLRTARGVAVAIPLVLKSDVKYHRGLNDFFLIGSSFFKGPPFREGLNRSASKKNPFGTPKRRYS